MTMRLQPSHRQRTFLVCQPSKAVIRSAHIGLTVILTVLLGGLAKRVTQYAELEATHVELLFELA